MFCKVTGLNFALLPEITAFAPVKVATGVLCPTLYSFTLPVLAVMALENVAVSESVASGTLAPVGVWLVRYKALGFVT
ncbi:hypothetical protein D3C80_1957830 [compost metagenome]